MHKAIAAMLAVLGAMLLGSAPLAAKDAAFDQPAFSAMLDKAYAGDRSADLDWMRQVNARRFGYSSPRWEEADAAFAALDSDPAKALALAEDHIKADPLSIYAHFAAEVALGKLERAAEAARHHNLLVAYVASVTRGTDGATAATAWNAVSVAEEYQVFGLLNLNPGQQALVSDHGKNYDLMSVTDGETGKPRQIYFDIDFYFGKEFEGLGD